jgi:hypothetical protein
VKETGPNTKMNNPNKAMGFRLPKFPKNKIKKIGIRSVIL